MVKAMDFAYGGDSTSDGSSPFARRIAIVHNPTAGGGGSGGAASDGRFAEALLAANRVLSEAGAEGSADTAVDQEVRALGPQLFRLGFDTLEEASLSSVSPGTLLRDKLATVADALNSKDTTKDASEEGPKDGTGADGDAAGSVKVSPVVDVGRRLLAAVEAALKGGKGGKGGDDDTMAAVDTAGVLRVAGGAMGVICNGRRLLVTAEDGFSADDMALLEVRRRKKDR